MSTAEERALEDALEKSGSPAPAKKAAKHNATKPAKKKPKPKKKAQAQEPAKESPPHPEADPGGTQAAKAAADAARREKAIADAPRAPDPSTEDKAEQKRKADLRARMTEIQAEIDELAGQLDAKKAELREVSAELYPHMERSDHHTVAVKGYVERQKELRATRATNPETIKRMIAQASKAPIDAAMSRAKARGQKRPERPLAGVSPAKDPAKE